MGWDPWEAGSSQIPSSLSYFSPVLAWVRLSQFTLIPRKLTSYTSSSEKEANQHKAVHAGQGTWPPGQPCQPRSTAASTGQAQTLGTRTLLVTGVTLEGPALFTQACDT